MKQAILITAYKNVEHLHRIVDSLESNYSFYFHIDKKSKIPETELARLRLKNKVKLVEKKFKVNWGGINLTRAILYLAEQALKEEVDYLHILSGSDFPIKDGREISFRISSNKPAEYIENFKLPYEFWENGGMSRLEYYYLTDIFNAQSFIGKKIINFVLFIQRKLNIRRKLKPDFPSIYGGSTWWSLSAPCMRFVFQFLKDNPDYFHRFKNTWIPDEFFFQTIIMNSKFKGHVENNNQRMIIWESLEKSHPKILEEADFVQIEQSPQLFARKFEPGMSDSLLELLNARNIRRSVNSIEGSISSRSAM